MRRQRRSAEEESERKIAVRHTLPQGKLDEIVEALRADRLTSLEIWGVGLEPVDAVRAEWRRDATLSVFFRRHGTCMTLCMA